MAPVDSLSSSTKNSGGSHIEIKAAGNPQTVDENTFGGTETAPVKASTQKAASAEPAKYEPAKHEPAKETAKAEPTAPTLPQTGDESAPAAGVIAAAAAGAIALASSLRLRLFQR
jgi:LPXTG-motif cell wall-anchored protein